MDDQQVLADQIAYYRARAGEYDEWFLRLGRYDHGAEQRAEWFREVQTLEEAVRSTVAGGDVLELACGTGLWTQHLAAISDRLLAIDASPEAIAINRERVRSPKVEYAVADIFSWSTSQTFDCVFFSFWLSHVPPERFDTFWTTVRQALRPQAQAFFIDSLREQTSTARDHDPVDGSGRVRRRLNDQREFEIVKVFYDPESLQRRLAERGWQGWTRSTGRFFLYGTMKPVQDPVQR